jgi:hypothetical protein
LASNRAIAVAAVFAGALIAAPAVSHADNGRLVVQVKGKNASGFRSQLKGIIKDADYRVVKTSAYFKAAKKLGAEDINDANVKKVARAKKLEAIILGRSEKKGSGYELRLSVRYGKSGAEIVEIVVDTKGDKLSSSELDRIETQLVPALRGEKVAAPPKKDPPKKDPPKKDPPKKDPPKKDPPRGDDDDDDNGDDDDDDDDDKGEDPLVDGAAMPWMELSGGLGLNRRAFNYDVQGDVGDARPEDWTNGIAPIISLNVEAFPLARDPKKKGALTNLGVELGYDRVVLFNATIVDMDVESKLGTTHHQLRGNIVYRYFIMGGKLRLRGGAGYVFKQFDIDSGNSVVDLPNVKYQGVDGNVAARYTINDTMKAGIDGGYLYLLRGGEVDNPDQYGDAGISGFHVGAAFDYRVNPTIAVRAGFSAQIINLSFDGDGELRDVNNDMNPDVAGASDTQVWFYARAVYDL